MQPYGQTPPSTLSVYAFYGCTLSTRYSLTFIFIDLLVLDQVVSFSLSNALLASPILRRMSDAQHGINIPRKTYSFTFSVKSV